MASKASYTPTPRFVRIEPLEAPPALSEDYQAAWEEMRDFILASFNIPHEALGCVSYSFMRSPANPAGM